MIKAVKRGAKLTRSVARGLWSDGGSLGQKAVRGGIWVMGSTACTRILAIALRPYRRLLSAARTKVIGHGELGGILFGQQTVTTQFFFLQNVGQYCTIPLRDFPHYRFLCDHLDEPYSDHVYARYLTCSWDYYPSYENTPENRWEQIRSFINLFRDIKARKHLNERALRHPLLVCKRPDGRILIIDGNHRAAVALRLGLDVRALFVPPVKHLARVIAVPEERFGTKRLGRPYQSVFREGRELVKGRRRDIYDRMQLIPSEDIEGKRILDLGCNIGMNCYIAAERGAAEAVGVDGSPRIATAAVRLNSYFAQPACRFLVHDLNQPFELMGRFDTVLCFSLVKHLTSTRELVATILRSGCKALYFEGHAGTTKCDYDYLLNEKHFAHIDLIGHGPDGVHTRRRTRPIFRCTR